MVVSDFLVMHFPVCFDLDCLDCCLAAHCWFLSKYLNVYSVLLSYDLSLILFVEKANLNQYAL